jgi:LacI family transcriptional regulator
MAPTKRPTTVQDIAEACGVSRWSVSAVLFPTARNHHVGASEETRAKVLAAAKRLNYRPHRSSRKLKLQAHGVLGILTRSLYNIPVPSLHAMLESAQRQGQVISIESYAPTATGPLPLFLRENVVDGLVFFEFPDQRIREAVARHRIPAVYVNTSIRAQPDAINMDEAGAIRQAVSHLDEQGRRGPALVVSDTIAPYNRERIGAMTAVCRERKLMAPPIVDLGLSPAGEDAAFTLLSAFLQRTPACDAMIVPHDDIAGMVYRHARSTQRRIPQDLAVVCMQDPDRLLNFVPKVTAFRLPEREFGLLAVERLNQLIQGGRKHDEHVLEYGFCVRGST